MSSQAGSGAADQNVAIPIELEMFFKNIKSLVWSNFHSAEINAQKKSSGNESTHYTW